MNDLMTVFLATEACRYWGAKDINLYIGYLPFARQDRRMVSGDPHSLKVISTMINAQKYANVFILDPHSDTSLALIDNSRAIPNDYLAASALGRQVSMHGVIDFADDVIVAPDYGAQKKIFSLAQRIGWNKPIIVASKIRDLKDRGKIIGTTIDDVSSLKPGSNVTIIDDICDGGATFIGIAETLRKVQPKLTINLVVTHGLFTKGLTPFVGLIDHIYTTDSCFSDTAPEIKTWTAPTLTVIPVNPHF